MKDTKPTVGIVPFPPGYRASGLLLHITSLPSPYGIGDVGPAAFTWIDLLHQAGQSWWQPLPFGPTGQYDSPYQSLSSFVGNELIISPDLLIEEALLQPGDCAGEFSKTRVDYDVVIPFKRRLLRTAWRNFRAGARKDLLPAYEQFRSIRAEWLEDYALFRALKAKYDNANYLEWPPELVKRDPAALSQVRRDLASVIDQVCLSQFLLFRQGERLKEHARARNVRLIGDIPFFVSPDSSDVWANPELFLLDEHYRPRCVAGVPPDYFNAEGQLWSNPVYNWEAHRSTGFRWWLSRLRALLAHVDLIRLDHFRAFAAAWHIPAEAPTAQTGQWVPGPGAALFSAVQDELGTLPFLAEDLGEITPDVSALRDQFQIPGTRVLQFAFDGHPENPHLPENFTSNTVVYTGTHDNNTTRAWFEELSASEREIVWTCLGRPGGQVCDAARELIRMAWSSRAALAITPLQDLLNLGSDARMNVPGRAEGNWRWRATEQMLCGPEFQWLEELTRTSNRSGTLPAPEKAIAARSPTQPPEDRRLDRIRDLLYRRA
jgi:4-alpha-glucanotransferase